MGLFTRIFGDESSKFIKKAEKIVAKVNALEADVAKLPDEDFQKKTQEFRDRLAKNETMDDILPEAFALVREAMKRVDGKRLFDVQIVGGLALHQGKIAEMKTGEGKTFVAVLPAYLNAITGEGVHIITVNDYLSRIGAVLMGQVYNFLGLSVGVINSQNVSYLYDEKHFRKEVPTESRGSSTAEAVGKDRERDQVGEFKIVYDFLKPCSRRVAYLADVTYGTNHEYGFDYLRDNLVTTLDEIVQRKHNFAIVDEVDSILIDEARTPLIISTPDEESTKLYEQFAGLTPRLKENEDYNLDEKMKAVTLTDEGIAKVEKILGMDIYNDQGIKYVHHLEQALRAQTLFKKDRDYVVKDGEVLIVDEFTGRLMPGRRYSLGLHQALEAKEGVAVQRESRTMATITFQNYFRMYEKLAGMTGTAKTSDEEFQQVYNLPVAVIPTHKPMVRQDLPDLIYVSEKAKFQAIVEDIKEKMAEGRAVLVGTASIRKNELLHEWLQKSGLTHEVLNAKNHEREAQIIARAGQPRAVTVATNMAGRGVDIKLAESVKAAGGLHIIGTERHEARRIDNQLRGRTGRQGDPGSSKFYLSLEDDLMRIFGSDKISGLMQRLGMEEGQEIQHPLVTRAVETAQRRVEGRNFEIRKHLLEYDDVMNRQREIIYEERNRVLESADLTDHVIEMIENFADELILKYMNPEIREEERSGEGLRTALRAKCGIDVEDPYFTKDTFDAFREEIVEKVKGHLLASGVK